LFDTVSTGVGDLYDLSIPWQAENVVHFTARDEMRRLFPLESVTNLNNPNNLSRLELTFPGAHSDIGGSYDRNGLSDAYLGMAHTYMRRVGIPMKELPSTYAPNPWQFHIHDSRYDMDLILDANGVNRNRVIKYSEHK
jgi:hypothetical protein